MIDLGKVKPGSTVRIPFNTFTSDDPAASSTITNLAAGDIEIHKDGGTTQRASDDGVSVSINFDSVTGQHYAIIDLSSNVDAGFYTAGSVYDVRMEGTTVDAGTVNAWIGRFTIGYEGAIHETSIATLSTQQGFTLTAGSGDDGAYVGCPCIIHDVASAVQTAQGVISGYTGSSLTVALAFDPSIFTMAAGDNISIFPRQNVHAYAGTVQSADPPTAAEVVDEWETQSQADPTGFHVNVLEVNGTAQTANDNGADINAILTDTNSLNDTKIPDTLSLANINGEVDTALTDYDAVVPADLPANFGDLSITASTGRVDVASIEGSDATDQINAACDTAIETYGLDHLVSAAVTGTDVADNSIIAQMVDDAATADWDNYDNTTASLEALNVDADAILADTNELQTNQGDWATATGFSTHSAEDVRTEMDSNSTQLAAIVEDTNELQTDDTPGTLATISGKVDTAQADLDIITGADGVNLLSATQASIDAIETDTETTIPTAISGLENLSASEVNDEVADVLDTDTYAEVSGIPAATSSLKDKIGLLFALARNEINQTSSTTTLRNDADSGDIGSASISDDSTTFSRGEFS